MSDRDTSGRAWQILPSEYLSQRPASYKVSQPASQYLTMEDGCRIAIDTYLPERLATAGAAVPPSKFPTIVILTPYYRRFKLSEPNTDPSPNAAKYRDFFIPRGYALVVVDVRGTGASFGTRDSFRSPRELSDYREVADWIVAQPWSNGSLGSTGISYLGAAACFLASTGHPAVKAIAPLFSVSDTYSDHVFPGGLKCTTVTEHYDDLVQALDRDQRGELKRYPYFADPLFAGPQPVDADTDGSLVQQAVAEHQNNFKLRDFAPEMAFREEVSLHDPNLHSGVCSPYWYMDQVSELVAIYSVSGWYDGSSYVNGSISRFLSRKNVDDRLLLGPWDHGARGNGSPWRGEKLEAEFPLMAEILRFFDAHLMGLQTGIEKEMPIHFHTVHQETWQSATQWPPVQTIQKMYLQKNASLGTEADSTETKATYQVDFTLGTGSSTRYERLEAKAVNAFYGDWPKHEKRMLSFSSSVLDRDTTLSGHVIVDLNVATSERDAALFVYLSEVDSDGRPWFVTDGALRMLHRHTSICPSQYQTTWPYRSFYRKDTQLMTPHAASQLRFALLPISWTFKAGSCIRLSISGADADHFAQVPHGRPPLLSITLGGESASFIEMPIQT